jgi:hypothetical protein
METTETTADWAMEATVTPLQTVVYGGITYNCTQTPRIFERI